MSLSESEDVVFSYKPSSSRFHFVQIRFSDFKILPRLVPALKTLFAEEIGEMEVRRERRELRNPRGNGSSEATPPVMGRDARRGREEAEPQGQQAKRPKTS